MNALEIEKAVAALRQGRLVAFPTETVYGLGCDAANPDAIRRLYAAKGRPADHPVIVHVADVVQMPLWARDIPAPAYTLAAKFWPGPLTLILKKQPQVTGLVTGGQDSVGLRVPAHPVAHALLAAFGGGIAAPSANKFGRVSATRADDVRRDLGDAVDVVLDGELPEVGIESTIVDLTGAGPRVLRPGAITPAMIEEVLGIPVGIGGSDAPRASGTLASHYAPATPLMLMAADLMLELATSLSRQGKQVAVLAHTAAQPPGSSDAWITAPQDAAGYAHALYANLRALDAAGRDVILVEALPQTPEWAAVRDRLKRAATSANER
ncbi:MAG: L-threonylcarbamoyladenylate synthase [Burkholderiales bacterium]